jgi:hypothetical protein
VKTFHALVFSLSFQFPTIPHFPLGNARKTTVRNDNATPRKQEPTSRQRRMAGGKGGKKFSSSPKKKLDIPLV